MDEGRRAPTRGDGLPPGVPAEAVKTPGMLRPQYTDYWITGGEVGRWPVWQVGAFVALQVIGIGLLVWGATGQYGWGPIRPHPDQFWFVWLITLLITFALLTVGLVRARSVYRSTQDLRHARYVCWITPPTLGMVVFACWFWISMLLGHGVVPRVVAAAVIAMSIVGFVAQFATAPRVGTTLRCARCGYPFDNAEDYLCSECGKAWLAPSGLVRGDKIRPKPLHCGVFGVCVLPVVATVLLMLVAGVHRFTPTERLIEQAIRQTTEFVFFGNVDAWSELDRRGLSPAQVTRIVDALLVDEDDPTTLTSEARGWLLRRLQAGELPEPAVERILMQAVSPLVAVPREARVGEAFSVRAEALPTQDRVRIIDAAVAVRSRAGGDERRAERFVPVQAGLRSGPGLTTVQQLTADAPGDLEITLDFWVFAVPGSRAGEIVWRPDGTPEPPQGAYGSVRRTLTGTVRVLPAEEP